MITLTIAAFILYMILAVLLGGAFGAFFIIKVVS